MNTTQLRHFFIIIIFCIGAFFVNLGLFEADLMESRNFITAREMIQKGNWLIPTMNNELRLEKQPFVTWLAAASALIGNSTTDLFIMRLPSAIIATIMVLFFYGICFELTRSAPFSYLGAIVFLTSLLVVQMARVNSWDIFTHAFMTGSIWLQLKALNKKTSNLNLWIGAGLLMGLSVFSKGPVSLYALWIPFVLSYIFFFDKQNLVSNIWKLLMMLLLAIGIGMAWNFYLYLEAPEAIAHVVDKETTAWTSRHVRPFYFYFHFPVYIGIWSIPLLGALFIRSFRSKIKERGNYRFLLAWVLIILLLLSVIPEKKERYMLPMEIPMSLLVTYLLFSIKSNYLKHHVQKSGRLLVKIQGTISLLILMALPVLSYFILKEEFFNALFLTCGPIFILTAIYLLYRLYKSTDVNQFKVAVLASVLAVLSITTVYLPVLAKMVNNPDYRDISEVAQMKQFSNTEFISDTELNMKIIYRLQKPVTPVDINLFQLEKNKPVLFFSHSDLLYNTTINTKYKITPVGIYDCNESSTDCPVYVCIIETI